MYAFEVFCFEKINILKVVFRFLSFIVRDEEIWYVPLLFIKCFLMIGVFILYLDRVSQQDNFDLARYVRSGGSYL